MHPVLGAIKTHFYILAWVYAAYIPKTDVRSRAHYPCIVASTKMFMSDELMQFGISAVAQSTYVIRNYVVNTRVLLRRDERKQKIIKKLFLNLKNLIKTGHRVRKDRVLNIQECRPGHSAMQRHCGLLFF